MTPRSGPLTKHEKERIKEFKKWDITLNPGRCAPLLLRGHCNSTVGGSGNHLIGPLIRTCQKCGKQFYFVQGPFQNIDGLKITPYRNQKKCPDCKDKEKEKPLPRPCAWCEEVFTPKRRNDAETCTSTCRKNLSDDRIKKDKERFRLILSRAA